MTMRPLLSEQGPKQSIWIAANHCAVAGLEYSLSGGTDRVTISGAIPKSCIGPGGTVILKFSTEHVRSFKETGVDTRQRGIGIEKVTIRDALH
jgi:hypothetical protein